MVNKLKLLITGVAGFIGSNFVYYFLEKYSDSEIIGLDKLTYAGNLSNLNNLSENQRSRFHFIKGDVCDRSTVEEIFKKNEIGGVINFAAESHVDRSLYEPQLFLTSNILGTHTLIDVARKEWSDIGEQRFLQISTDEVYGELGPTGFFTEESQIQPRSPYSASKASADLIVQAYHETFGMSTLITRCSNNYGPFQFPEKLIPLMINNAKNHKHLPVYGNGLQIRDWIHVEDHCAAIDAVFQKGECGEVYNIGARTEKTNITVVKTIIQLVREMTSDSKVNEDLIQYVQDRLGHDKRYAIDSTKIETHLGWKPKYNFEEGLCSTVQWYLENEDWIQQIVSGEYKQFYEMHYKELK